jgi:hypothetical protein
MDHQQTKNEQARSSTSLPGPGPREQDVKELEEGMNLIKINTNFSQSDDNHRFFRLDLANHRLVASTKEFLKKEKICK